MAITTHNVNGITLSPHFLESTVAGELLGEFKASTWIGISLNYADIHIKFRDYADPNLRGGIKVLILTASTSHDPPGYTTWLDKMIDVFEPIYNVLYENNYGEKPKKRKYSFLNKD